MNNGEKYISNLLSVLPYEQRTEMIMNGARILETEIDGYGIKLVLDNGYVLNYDATDGGYSSWTIEKEG